MKEIKKLEIKYKILAKVLFVFVLFEVGVVFNQADYVQQEDEKYAKRNLLQEEILKTLEIRD